MSATPSTETSALSLTSATKSLPSGGRMVRIACGNDHQPEPLPAGQPERLRRLDLARRSTDWMPARNTSAMKAA